MFRGDLYTISSKTVGDVEALFNIAVNSDCDIFKGHFPGNPIIPGVCMLQVAVELCEDIFAHRCELIKCKNVKYLQTINPYEHPQVQYRMTWLASQEQIYLVKLEICDGETIFSKMSIEVR